MLIRIVLPAFVGSLMKCAQIEWATQPIQPLNEKNALESAIKLQTIVWMGSETSAVIDTVASPDQI